MKVLSLMQWPPKRDWPTIAASLSMREQHQVMRRVLQREHARAARHGKPFSLVVLHIDRLAAHRAVRRLHQAICRRIRLTDEIGWLDNDRLAVLLPQTTDAGARQFASHLRQLPQFLAVWPRLSVHIYSPAPVVAPDAQRPAREIEIDWESTVRLDVPRPAGDMESP